MFLRSGQTGAQPSGAGHSAGPCVHGPGEPDTVEALPATGLFILQTDGLRLEDLSRGEQLGRRREAREDPEDPGVGGERSEVGARMS